MTRRNTLHFVRAAAVAVGLAVTPAARADAPNAEAAQTLFDEGKALLGADRASEACPKFEESQRLDPALGTLLNLADCYERVGRLGGAWTTFRAAAAQARREGHADAAVVADERAQALAARLPKLRIDVPGAEHVPGLSVQRDGALVDPADFGRAVPAEPGTHHLVVSAPGRKSWVGTVVVGDAPSLAHVDVPELAREVAPASGGAGSRDEAATARLRWDAQRTGAVASAGLGVAGLVVGSVYGLKSLARGDDADAFCDGPRCREPEGVRLRSEARDAGTVSTIAFAIGALGVAGGAFLWFTAPAGEAGVQVGVGPHGAAVRARF